MQILLEEWVACRASEVGNSAPTKVNSLTSLRKNASQSGQVLILIYHTNPRILCNSRAVVQEEKEKLIRRLQTIEDYLTSFESQVNSICVY